MLTTVQSGSKWVVPCTSVGCWLPAAWHGMVGFLHCDELTRLASRKLLWGTLHIVWIAHETHMTAAISAGGKRIRLRTHASSVLHRVPAQWLVFSGAARGPGGWFDMREVSTIQPEWLPELAPQMFRDTRKRVA